MPLHAVARIALPAAVALGLATVGLTGCGEDDDAPDPDVVAACQACLASGQSFSGGECVSSCLQDTYCFGPGNPAASTCPTDPADYDSDPF